MPSTWRWRPPATTPFTSSSPSASRRCSCRWTATPTISTRAPAGRRPRGVGLAVSGAGDPALESQLEQLARPGGGRAPALRLRAAFPGNGAAAAARIVADAAGGEAAAAKPRPGSLGRWLRLSSHPVGPTLPLVLALGGRDLLRHPERRRPHLVILAAGVPPGELRERVGRRDQGGAGPSRGERWSSPTPGSSPSSATWAWRSSTCLRSTRGRRRPAPSSSGSAGAVRVLLAGRRPHRAVSVGLLGPEILGIPEGS